MDLSECTEREYRNSLSEGEFWAHVFQLDYDFYEDYYLDDEPPTNEDYPDPCPICRSITACGFDSEGRPMIHVVEDKDD